MRLVPTLVAFVIAVPLAAQNWYVPDNNAATGTGCNVIPFGQSAGGPFSQSKYQVKATQADLGMLPGVITGLGFAPCLGGTSHFDSIEVILDHHPAGSLSTTFAANLTPSAVTVLAATDYSWNTTSDTWHELGLQNYFVYNGIDDLVIQITCVNATSPVQGFHTDGRQRVYWFATSGTAPAGGQSDLAAHKFEVGMIMARISSYGIGCVGSNGTTPTHATSGAPQLTQTIGFDLQNGVPSGFGILVLGFDNASPLFPLELSGFGMPNCFQYHDIVAIRFVLLDGAGAGSAPMTIPNDAGLLAVRLYSQYACIDPPANATGITTSNYNRILIGN